MIDIETLGTAHDCMILSIAVVRFYEDKDTTDELILYPDLIEQEKHGRKIEVDTLKWWMDKHAVFMTNLNPTIPRKSVSFCYNQLAWFLKSDKEGRTIWAKSPTFDLEKLRHLFRFAPALWDYREESDVRTAYAKLKQKQLDILRPTTSHDPICDAITQSQNIRTFLSL